MDYLLVYVMVCQIIRKSLRRNEYDYVGKTCRNAVDAYPSVFLSYPVVDGWAHNSLSLESEVNIFFETGKVVKHRWAWNPTIKCLECHVRQI